MANLMSSRGESGQNRKREWVRCLGHQWRAIFALQVVFAALQCTAAYNPVVLTQIALSIERTTPLDAQLWVLDREVPLRTAMGILRNLSHIHSNARKQQEEYGSGYDDNASEEISMEIYKSVKAQYDLRNNAIGSETIANCLSGA
uniref:PBPe domain-containing protein n=1 Tax=Ascaris lumbricoides TaxID=6252 RepID=A0A0M3I6I6_ASCLU